MKEVKKGLIALCALACVASVGTGVAQIQTSNVSAVTSAEFTVAMKEGASLRIGEDDGQNGLTYTVTMPKNEYETLMTNVGEGKKYKEVEFGVLIAPYAYHEYKALDETNVFGASAFYDWAEWTEGEDGKYSWVYTGNKVRIMNFTAESMYLEEPTDTYYSYAGSIVNILDGTNTDESNPNLLNNLTNEFYGVGYVKTTLNSDNSVDYVFAEDNKNNVSPAYIAQRALESDTTLTSIEKNWLEDNYIAKVPDSAKTTTYTVENYFENATGEYVLDTEKTSVEDNQTVGTEITVTANEYNGFMLNTENSMLTGKVYFNGKRCFKAYYDIGYMNDETLLVDKNEVSDEYDLKSLLSEDEKTFVESKQNVTYKLTNTKEEEQTFTDSTVTLSELANGLYTLDILSNDRVLYKATQVDIFNSTVFELIDESNFLNSFERNSSAQYMTLSQATTDELATMNMTGPALKADYRKGAQWARVNIVAMHSDAYYTTYFGDKKLQYDFYMTKDAGAIETTEFTVHYDTYANRKKLSVETVNTVEVSIANLISDSGRNWMLCRVYDGGQTYDVNTGSVYWGNFRLKAE